MQNKKITALMVFLLFLSVYMLLGNGKLTTSMDVDVLRYAEEFVKTGVYGSPNKLAGGVAYSTKTGLFYPLEGLGVVMPVIVAKYLSDIFTPESGYLVFMTGQVLMALTMLFFFLIMNVFVTHKKSLLYTAIIGLATPALVHSKLLMPEPVTMLVFMASIWCFVKYFYQNGKNYYLTLAGISAGAALFCRPDAAIFYLFFIAMTLTRLFFNQRELFLKKTVWFGSGLLVMAILFVANSYNQYGKFFETGYTIDKASAISALERDLETIEPDLQRIYNEANALYTQDKNSEATQLKIKEFTNAKQVFDSKKIYLDALDKQAEDSGDHQNNAVLTFFYGVYLIFVNPNRAVFFLSPVLLFLLLPLFYLYKNYKVETVFCALIFCGYVTLYALRAPQSYAGSAAWGIRYLLPVLMIFSLAFIGLDKAPFYLKNKKNLSKLLIGLAVLSFAFQLVGSAVNYQSVQMPLEYACKQKYGDKGSKWAYESRNQLMTGFSASLLINNWQILRGKIPQVLKNNLPSETVEMLQNSDQLEKGANDWLFYDAVVKKDVRIEGADTSKLGALFFILVITAAGSLFFLLKSKQTIEIK